MTSPDTFYYTPLDSIVFMPLRHMIGERTDSNFREKSIVFDSTSPKSYHFRDVRQGH